MAPPSYRLHGEWNIRLVDSGAMLEAPFAGGRGSAMLGGRFSYTGFVISLIAPNVSVGYWDYQARVRYDLNARDTVEVFGFGSSDYTTYTEKEPVVAADGSLQRKDREHTAVDVNFHRLDLRWDHKLDQGNWRQALMFGRDRTGFADGEIDVYDYMVGARSEYWRQVQPQLRLRAGADALFESLRQDFKNDTEPTREAPANADGTPGALPVAPTAADSGSETDAERFGFGGRRDFSLGAYADVVWEVAPGLVFTPGVRADLFVSGGTAAIGIDPRLTAEYRLSKRLKLVNGLALVHQAPSFIGPVPGLKPSLSGGLQRAVQSSAGVSYELPADITSSLAVFQSAFFNMTDLISLVQLEQTEGQTRRDLGSVRTMGHAYGLEVLIRRSLARRLGGFVSYTLSNTRRFTGRVSGPTTTDRVHVLNVAASYDLGKDWRFGTRVLFYTGIPAEVAYTEAARHPPRTPPFWRLDFKLEKRFYIKRPERYWGVSLEVLNTTLNKEKLSGSCNAFSCKFQELGPITVPSIAFEGAY
jgi:hypothetical protein